MFAFEKGQESEWYLIMVLHEGKDLVLMLLCCLCRAARGSMPSFHSESDFEEVLLIFSFLGLKQNKWLFLIQKLLVFFSVTA